MGNFKVLDTILLNHKHTNKFKVVNSVSININDTYKMSRAEKQKEKNERIKVLMKEYNNLCKEVKGRKPDEDELIKAKDLMFELRELRLFDKIRRM